MNQKLPAMHRRRATLGFGARIANFILFQFVWFATILGAARGLTWPAIITLTVFIILHRFISSAPKADFVLMPVAIVIGFICDSSILQFGLLNVKTTFPLPAVAPIWMLILWADFALAVNNSLGWLHDRYWLAAFFGAVGGPAAYLGGAALGAAELGASQLVVITSLSMLWAVITPLMFGIASQLQHRFPEV